MRSLIVRFLSLPLLLAAPAFAQNPPAPPKNPLDPANDPAIRKGLEDVHNELSNILKQQTELIKAVTPAPQICEPDNGNGNGNGNGDRLYGSGRTGLGLVPLSPELRLGTKLDPDTGILVRNVFPGTPAAQA